MKHVLFLLAELAEPRAVSLPNQEIRGIGWFTFDEARRLITYDNSREVPVRADAYLRKRNSRQGGP